MAIDLDELERLHAEAAGTPYKAKGDWIYAQSVSHKRTFSRRPMAYTIDNRDGRYKPTETAAYIVAACNAVPELIAENRKFQECMRELERQNDFFLKALKENFMCPYSRCKYDDGSELDEWECSTENNRECWIKAAKEAGE